MLVCEPATLVLHIEYAASVHVSADLEPAVWLTALQLTAAGERMSRRG